MTDFDVWHVREELGEDLLKAFFTFREAVRVECERFREERVKWSGFGDQLRTGDNCKTWTDIINADTGHIHVVVDKRSSRIVGMIKFVPDPDLPVYGNVLYLEDRGMVKPKVVFAAMARHYGFPVIRAGKIESKHGARHLTNCGFEKGLWVRDPQG